MDTEHDAVLYDTTVVLPAKEEEAAEEAQVTLRLLGDFPEPLTEPQRRAVQRHVVHQVREFEGVRRQVAVAELGYLALLRLVKRLRKEQAKLTASLTEGANPNPPAPDAAPTAVATSSSEAPSKPAAPATSADATKESTAGPKRRLGGPLLRSSVFSGLQRVLQAAKSEQQDEKMEQLSRQRERIAKETRLHLIAQDLAQQEVLLEPLQRKYTRAVAYAKETAEKSAPLLTLLDDMWRMEALYPSRFALHTTGALEPIMSGADAADKEEATVPQARCRNDGKNEEDNAAGGKAASERPKHADAASTAAAVSFVVPFTPAQYTSAVEERVRGQVEDVISDYLAYRTRMDPVLYQLEQQQQLAKAQKVERLMDWIGVAGAGGLGMSGAHNRAGDGILSSGDVFPEDGVSSLFNVAGKTKAEVLNISSSDEDAEDGSGERRANGEEGEDAADKDRQDREHIRTALTALDDFEDA